MKHDILKVAFALDLTTCFVLVAMIGHQLFNVRKTFVEIRHGKSRNRRDSI
jgi:hypothetical protein